MADRSAGPARPTRPSGAPSPLKVTYLTLYNFLSAVAWATVLGRTLSIYELRGPLFVHLGVGDWTKWTQTMAGMEVLHALFGIVRAPVLTTIMQVASRFVLVWGVVEPFPWLARSQFYTSMLLAWSVTEVIRYSFFALTLSGWQPRTLVWLRYNTFFVLYPIGILSEVMLIYYAAEPAKEYDAVYPWIAYAILAIYIPGSYILYTHMMKQRRRFFSIRKALDDQLRKEQ